MGLGMVSIGYPGDVHMGIHGIWIPMGIGTVWISVGVGMDMDIHWISMGTGKGMVWV